MSDHTPWPLIAKHLAGECSPEETLAMDWWLEDYANQQLYQQIKEAWQQEKEPENIHGFDVESGLNRLHAMISESKAAEKKWFLRIPKINSWLAAASVLILIGVGYSVVNQNNRKTAFARVVMSRQQTGDDKIINFTLPDGSKVWLNKNSKIDFPKTFLGDRREVFLEGEAFFEVVPNPQKPFIVKSEKVTTQVLGTSFNVKAYKGDETAAVSVATGKVEVSKEIAGSDPIRITQLTPQQELVINTKKDETYIDIVSRLDIGSWRNDPLVFRNNTYSEVIARLEVHYGIKIILKENNLTSCRVMASFNQDATLKNVLKVLSISNSFRYNIDGKQVTISGGVCR